MIKAYPIHTYSAIVVNNDPKCLTLNILASGGISVPVGGLEALLTLREAVEFALSEITFDEDPVLAYKRDNDL